MVQDYLADCKENVAFILKCEWPACMNELVNVIIDFAISKAPSPQDCLLCIRAGRLADLGDSLEIQYKD